MSSVRCFYEYTWARLGNFSKSNAFLEVRFKFAFGRNEIGKVFGILCYLKKMSKSNDVRAQNNVFKQYITSYYGR
jgi:hypothetical protein